MEKRPPTARHYVELELDGTCYVGSYAVESEVVTVVYGFSKKSTEVGDSTVERVARMLLRELIEDSLRGKR